MRRAGAAAAANCLALQEPGAWRKGTEAWLLVRVHPSPSQKREDWSLFTATC
jgi:hypothetical protein